MMAMAVLALLIAVSLPLTLSFYKTRQLDVYENGIVQALRRAQLKAMSVEADSAFGVYITLNQYILFRGNSYATPRDTTYDEVFDLPSNLPVTGLSEIIFSRLKGAPSVTGNITLTLDSKSETININEVGRINY